MLVYVSVALGRRFSCTGGICHDRSLRKNAITTTQQLDMKDDFIIVTFDGINTHTHYTIYLRTAIPVGDPELKLRDVVVSPKLFSSCRRE